MSADDCKPNKALRMTTKAFLKTAEKKRDSSQAKEATPITPVDSKPTPTPTAPDDKPPVEDANAEMVAAAGPQETQHEGEQTPQADGPLAEQNAALDTAETNAEHISAAEVEVCAALTPLRLISTDSATARAVGRKGVSGR